VCWCVGTGSTLLWQGAFQVFIYKDAGLGKTIHLLMNLAVNPTFRSDNVAKVVVDDEFVGDDANTETYVFEVWHGGVEIEIGEVNAKKLSPRGADCGTDEEFCRGEICHWCTFVPWIANAITTNSESNEIFFCILSAVNNCNICGRSWGVCELERDIWG
jgi:hypothetical protein